MDVEVHKKKGMDWVMNGINYSALFGNTTLFPQSKDINSNTKVKGQVTGANYKKENRMQDQETVDQYTRSQEMKKVTYDKPVMKKPAWDKKIDENGIQEGIELSDDAKKLLEELKEKYTNMEFRVAHWSSDEEEEYYASKCEKQFSVLIDPEALESMAADQEVKDKYLSALDQAGEQSEKLKDELGEDYDKIDSFSISIDKDGKMSFTAKLIEDFANSNKSNSVSIKERLEQKKAAEKQNEKLQARRKDTEPTRIKKDSLDELIAAIKEAVQPKETEKIQEQ